MPTTERRFVYFRTAGDALGTGTASTTGNNAPPSSRPFEEGGAVASSTMTPRDRRVAARATLRESTGTGNMATGNGDHGAGERVDGPTTGRPSASSPAAIVGAALQRSWTNGRHD